MNNDCVVAHEDDEFEYFDQSLNRKVFTAAQKYINMIGCSPKLKVWYDLKDDICFGAEQDFYKNPAEFSFFTTVENFLNSQKNPIWGKQALLEKLGKTLGMETVETSEYIIPSNVYEKFRDKHILIVGAGPSTNDVQWEDMRIDYDDIWTCNNFHYNNKFDDKKVSLATIGPNIDLADENLLAKIREDNTLCMFEGGVSPFRVEEELSKFKIQHSNVSYFHLRYFSKIGTAARLVALATLLGARKVSFVGVDGHPIGNVHSFEGDDKVHNGAPLIKNSFNIFRRQYVLFWDYLLNEINNGTEYVNLGEGHAANLSTDISRRGFK